MKTINFCGDSFCQLVPKVDDRSLSWPILLADKLNASIIGWGNPGAAYEHAIRSFNDKVWEISMMFLCKRIKVSYRQFFTCPMSYINVFITI